MRSVADTGDANVKSKRYQRVKLLSVITFSCLLILLSFAGAARAGVTLTPSQSSGALVGSQIVWTASDSTPGLKHYRFTVSYPNGSTLIVRDFDFFNSFPWTPLEEGAYQVSVTVRDAATQTVQTVCRPFRVCSRVKCGKAVVSATQHPLVALYSVPSCSKGKEVRVQFRLKGGDCWYSTPFKPLQGKKSVNFLVAGMKAEETYELRHEVVSGGKNRVSESLCFKTGTSEIPPWDFNATLGPQTGTSLSDGVILHAILFGGEGQYLGLGCPVATDLDGNVVWYYKEPLDLANYAGSFLMSFPPSVSGTLLVPMARPPIPGLLPGPIRGQLLREIDLAGNFIRETNVERINEQLIAMGHDPIYYFHHDARRLPNGHTLVMAGVEKILTGVQGDGPIDVVGDMVIDLDKNFQVVWAWSTFGHDDLPVTRRALRDEVCTGVPLNVCGPLRLNGTNPGQAEVAHDWTHGNTVTYTPADGNILLSFRHQDWLVKIDYANGKGSGKILWRLGEGGDFDLKQKLEVPDPHPWFSAQHQPMVYAQNEVVVYDNSNARNENSSGESFNSRGQVYLLNEKARKATLVTNADLGVYASFLGSAQKLSNGNYHFLSGGIAGDQPSPVPGFPAGLSESTETDAEGNLIYTLQAPFHTTYRSFRMKSMYRPAGIPGDVDGDSDVDRLDLAEITSKLLKPVSAGFDPCDVDGDGWITLFDLHKAAKHCTLPQCKTLEWVNDVLGY
jgi:hypothetical protein